MGIGSRGYGNKNKENYPPTLDPTYSHSYLSYVARTPTQSIHPRHAFFPHLPSHRA